MHRAETMMATSCAPSFSHSTQHLHTGHSYLTSNISKHTIKHRNTNSESNPISLKVISFYFHAFIGLLLSFLLIFISFGALLLSVRCSFFSLHHIWSQSQNMFWIFINSMDFTCCSRFRRSYCSSSPFQLMS